MTLVNTLLCLAFLAGFLLVFGLNLFVVDLLENRRQLVRKLSRLCRELVGQ